VEQQDGGIFRGCRRIIEGLLRHRTTRCRIDNFCQVCAPAKGLEQLELGERIVVVIGNRIVNRRLIPVVAR